MLPGFAWRMYRSRFRDSALILLGVIMISALLTSLLISAQLSASQFKAVYSASTSDIDLVITSKQGALFNQSIVSAISQVQGVRAAFPRLLTYGNFTVKGANRTTWTLIGVDLTKDFELSHIAAFQGRVLGATNMVISQDVAIVFSKLAPNVTTISYWPSNVTHYDFSIAGIIIPAPLQLWIRGMVFVDLLHLQIMLHLEKEVSVIYVKLTDIDQSAYVSQRLASILGPNFYVEQRKASVQQELNQDISNFQAILSLPLVYASLLTIIFVSTVIYLNAFDRAAAVRSLRTVGFIRRQVLQLFTYESLLIVLPASLVGSVLGVIVYQAMIYFDPNSGGAAFPFAAVLPLALSAATIALLLGGLSCVITFIVVYSRTTEQSSQTNQKQSVIRRLAKRADAILLLTLLGVSMIPALLKGLFNTSLFLILISLLNFTLVWLVYHPTIISPRVLMGRFEFLNLIPHTSQYNRKKIFALVAIVTLCTGFTVMEPGVEAVLLQSSLSTVSRTLGADIIAAPMFPSPVSFTSNISALKGVQAVSPVTALFPRILNLTIPVLLFQPETLGQVLTLDFTSKISSDPYKDAGVAGSIFITDTLLQLVNQTSSQPVRLGKGIQLSSSLGNWTVIPVATFSDRYLHWLSISDFPMTLSILMPYDTYQSLVSTSNVQNASLYLIKIKDQANITAVSQEVKTEGIKVDLLPYSIRDIEDQIRGTVNLLFVAMRAISTISILLSGIITLIMSAANIQERRIELALFKTLGATWRQISGIIIGEVGSIILVGAIVGSLTAASLILLLPTVAGNFPIKAQVDPLLITYALAAALSLGATGIYLAFRRLNRRSIRSLMYD